MFNHAVRQYMVRQYRGGEGAFGGGSIDPVVNSWPFYKKDRRSRLHLRADNHSHSEPSYSARVEQGPHNKKNLSPG